MLRHPPSAICQGVGNVFVKLIKMNANPKLLMHLEGAEEIWSENAILLLFHISKSTRLISLVTVDSLFLFFMSILL